MKKRVSLGHLESDLRKDNPKCVKFCAHGYMFIILKAKKGWKTYWKKNGGPERYIFLQRTGASTTAESKASNWAWRKILIEKGEITVMDEEE